MIIVFAGSIGRFPVGGHAWINLQYLLGLRDLGHDVYYLEDGGDACWVHVWETARTVDDPDYSAAYVRSTLAPFGFGERWILRAGDRSFGMPLRTFRDLCTAADLLIVRGSPLRIWRPEYMWPRRRAYLDTDPGYTQISLAAGEPLLRETVERCESLFTLAQRLGAPDCRIPGDRRRWQPTLSPVWLPGWPVAPTPDGARFTTVMQWRSYNEGHAFLALEQDGRPFGQKDETFADYADLPKRTAQRLHLALTGGDPDHLARLGWDVVTGWRATATADRYQRFIQTSRAEFAFAKSGYVLSRGGWFSDRSVCYLASGKPVLVQDTGLADWLPVGEGILTFSGPDDALAGIDAIARDHGRHAAAARGVAVRHFAADRVLGRLVENSCNA